MKALNRRAFITASLLGAGALMLPSSVWAATNKGQRYKVAVIDLMILKRQKVSAVALAKELGADGLEVDMGGLGNRDTFDNKFFDEAFLKEYREALTANNIEVASVAMTGFYAQSFAERATYKQMVGDCLKTCQLLGTKIAFLPLGVKGDLVQHPELHPAIVERLKEAGKMAKKAGVTIAIETALDARGEVELLKEIGSKNIQIYFNFSNPLKAGRDLIEELQILGKKHIAQIHCTDEDGVWLENNTRLDMPKVKKALDKMGWSGWLVIERSRDAQMPTNVKENFSANTRYVKSIFQK